VPLRNTIELVWQGEHRMPVVNIQQVLALSFNPLRASERLTAGAVPIATGGVLNSHVLARIALVLEATERCRAAVHQRSENTIMMARQRVRRPIVPPTGSDNIRQFERRATARTLVRYTAHRSGSRRLDLGEVQ